MVHPLPHTSSWHGAWLIEHRDNFTFTLRCRGQNTNLPDCLDTSLAAITTDERSAQTLPDERPVSPPVTEKSNMN
jgi:hypothetical protein